jgi:uncharacterized protein (TIGR03437 family)
LSRVNTLVFAGLMAAFSAAHPASAQTSAVANLTVQSGNGQVACLCITASLQAFQPISVKATDTHGNPVVGATVSWSVTPVLGQAVSLGSQTSVTGANGIATQSISLIILNNFTSTAVPYLVSNIQAASNGSTVTFTETQSLVTPQAASVIQAAPPTFNGANLSEATLSANVGTTLSTPIQVEVSGVDIASNGVANVSVRIVNEQASPTLSCAYQGGYGDPGSVLSNSQGLATCYPVFSGSGTGTFYILIGGVPASDISTALDLQEYPNYSGPSSFGYSFTSIAGTPAAVQIVSGNNQVANIGVPLNPLVAKLTDANGNPVEGQTMAVSVVPAGAAALMVSSATTDNNGEVTIQATLDILASAAGVQIIVALQSNPNISVTFQESLPGSVTGPTPNGMSIVSGNSQSAMINAAFAQPLVVQVNSASGPVSGYVVNFASTGPVSLPTASATTNSSGQAQIMVSAGSTSGAATVTASISGYFQTFNLTVLPTGSIITAGDFLNAASRQVAALSPCSLAILSAPGITPDGAADYALAPIFGRLPKSVHHLTLTIGGVPAPIMSVALGATNPEVTFQVPCEVTPGSSVPAVLTTNGGGTATVNIPIQTVSPGILQAAMSDGVSRAVVVRSDGSFADVGGTDTYDPNNPARLNENVRIYVTGLGATLPAVGTDSIQDPNADLIGFDATVTGTVQVGIVGFGNLQVITQRQAPDLIGVYEVQVFIPSNAPTGNNVQISVGVVPAGSNSSTPATFGPNAVIAIGQ